MSLIKQIKLEDNLYDIGAKWSNIDKENNIYGLNKIITFEDDKVESLKKCIVNIKPFQAGSGDPSPTNIRAISGWDTVNIWRFAKNYFPQQNVIFNVGTGNVTVRFPHALPVGNYTLSADLTSTYSENCLVHIVKLDGTYIEATGTPGTRVSVNFQSVSENEIIGIRFYVGSNYNTSYNNSGAWSNIQVEIESTATAYEVPSIFTFSDLPEMVYGGTLDVTAGLLTVDRKGYVFDGTENWMQFWDAPYRIYRLIRNGQVKTLTGRASSHFINAQVTSGTTDIGYYAYNGTASATYIQFRPNLDDIPDLDSWKAWLAAQAQAGTPLTCYHTIATPQVYHLTPIEISTLLGENNIWADCGDISIELENFYSDIQTEITTNLNENTLLYKNNNSLISSNILIENDDLYFSKLDTYSPPGIFVSLNSDNKTYRNMDIGWTYSLGNGAVLGLREEHFPSTPGAFFLCARRTLIENENTSILTTQFRGTPEGSITISNNDNTVCLNINTSMSTTINPKDYNLYVNGTSYLKGDTKISANTSTVGCTLQYDNTLNTLNFVFD